MKKVITLLWVVLFLFALLSLTYAAAPKSKLHTKRIVPFNDTQQLHFIPKKGDLSGLTKISKSPGVSVVQGAGNSFYDYQTNGGDEHRVHVLPDGSVHVIYMGSTERSSPGGSTRGTYYAYSSDKGATFTNLGRVEPQRAGFPSLDVTSDGRAVVASHTAPTGLVLGVGIFEDAVPGFAIFNPYSAPRKPIECIWPRIAVPSDDNFIYWGSSNTASDNPQGNSWNNLNPKTAAFGFPENQLVFPDVEGEIRGTIARSAGGKVAIVLINFKDVPIPASFGENNIIMRESTDGGKSFGPPVNITNYIADTTTVPQPGLWLGISAIYVGEELHVVWTEVLDEVANDAGISYFFVNLRIKHWSPSVNGGLPTTAARWDSVHFAGDLGPGDDGVNHLRIDNPSIGVDADGILTVAFSASVGDSTGLDPITNLAYREIFAVSSANNGLQWGEPTNLTNSPDMDDRYPYISPWNESGKINVFYMSDSVAGNFIGVGADAAPVTTPDFLFLKTDHPSTKPYDFYSSVAERPSGVPAEYSLRQNYPNPFNPSTTITFSVPKATRVMLSIYDVTGKLVATLVNGKMAAGSHTVTWHAGKNPSGIYFAKLESEGFSSVKKLMLVK